MSVVEIAETNLPDNMICLLQELMHVDRHRRSLAHRNSIARMDAATIDARICFDRQQPLSVRQIAKLVSVSPSTILEWRKSPDYMQLVVDKQAMWKHRLPKTGKHPKKPKAL